MTASFRWIVLAMIVALGSSGCIGELNWGVDHEESSTSRHDLNTTSPGFYAISPDQGSFDSQQAQLLADFGVDMVRLQLCNWPADRDWMDLQVDAARAAGLRVYAEINYCTVGERDEWHRNFSDAGNEFSAKFTQAAREMAAHFQGRVDYWEIWNEPNASPRPIGFNGQPNHWPTPHNADWDGACTDYEYGTPYDQGEWALCPRQYGVVVTNSFMAIKDVDPDVGVVAGNMLYHGEDGWAATEYWKQVAQSPAVDWHVNTHGRFPWDVVGIHPYGSRPDNGELTREIDRFQSILNSYGDPATIALTEYGWRSRGSSDISVGQQTQAKYLRQTFEVAERKGLEFVVWFNYLDADHGGLSFGIRHHNMDWKASAGALCQVTGTQQCPVAGVAPPPSDPTPPSSGPPSVGKAADGSVDDAIVECYRRNGGQSSAGVPFDNGGGADAHRWGPGVVQDFDGGTLGPNLCMRRDGQPTAWMVRGGIRDGYFAAGGGEGALGYPVGEERQTSAGPAQSFEGGQMVWSVSQDRFVPQYW